MGKVILDMAMSLDGFIAGPNSEDWGLHDYFFSPSGATTLVIEDGFKTTGAIIMGRRAYDIGAEQDGFVDDPYQVPTFVLTHNIPEKAAKGAEAFIFITGGIESALQQAQSAAGDRDVVIGGGANTAQQFLMAVLIDKIQIHLVPKLFGQGIQLFDHTSIKPIELEIINVIDAPDVTHITYRIV